MVLGLTAASRQGQRPHGPGTKRIQKILGLSQPFTSSAAEAWTHLESEYRLTMRGWVAASEDLLVILPPAKAPHRS